MKTVRGGDGVTLGIGGKRGNTPDGVCAKDKSEWDWSRRRESPYPKYLKQYASPVAANRHTASKEAIVLRNNWHLDDRPELGAMNTLNSLLRLIDFADPRALPNLRGGRTILIGSDYGGQHAASHLEAFGFLFADGDRLGLWEEGRRELRKRYLPNARRMSFKTLNDRKRMEALPQFLTAADQLHGLLLVVLVDKKI